MVYTLFFVYLVFCALLSIKTRANHFFLFTIMVFLFAIIGLRNTTVGTDTLGYTQDFSEFSQLQFAQMWRIALESKEPLYVIISWLTSLFSENYTAYLLVWALFPVISLYKVFKTELSNGMDYMIAILVFFMLGLFAFFVAGIRQTAALSLTFAGAMYLARIDTLSLKYFIKDKNLYIFLLHIVIAYLIHNSALMFLLAIPCLFIKVRWWFLLLVGGLLFLGKHIHIDQIVGISTMLFNDRFSSYGTTYESTQSTSAFIMQFLLFIICFTRINRLEAQDKRNDFLLVLLFVGLIFQSLSGLLAEMSRVSFYFCMFSMILVPRAIRMYKPSLRAVVYLVFTIAAIVYLFFLSSSNLPEYQCVL